jgi:ABC-2 type transport system permease protein
VQTKTLPAVLQWFADVNPISHLITAVRSLVNDQQLTGDFWISLLGAAVVVAVFAPLTVRAYMRKA